MPESYYHKDYFTWQGPIGEFGGWANLPKFQPHLSENDRVVDFGCGGGFLLKNLICGERIGIEINEKARERATELGVKTVASIADVPDGWADVIVSNHCLEHVHRPLDTLRELLPKLRPGGKLVLYVPNETDQVEWVPNDINNHLYSWSPCELGNLAREAGFTVVTAGHLRHKWPPRYATIARLFGRRGFDLACYIWARLSRRTSQVWIHAERPPA